MKLLGLEVGASGDLSSICTPTSSLLAFLFYVEGSPCSCSFSSLKFPIVIGNYKCNAVKVASLCEDELKMYNLEYFPLPRKYYEPKGHNSKNIAGYHAHVQHLEEY